MKATNDHFFFHSVTLSFLHRFRCLNLIAALNEYFIAVKRYYIEFLLIKISLGNLAWKNIVDELLECFFSSSSSAAVKEMRNAPVKSKKKNRGKKLICSFFVRDKRF